MSVLHLNKTMRDILTARCVEVREPKPGLRHNGEVVYVRHRHPIKGGIAGHQIPNPLMKMVRLLP